MLLLGLVVHTCLSYFPTTPDLRNEDTWYFYDMAGSGILVPIYASIHLYRMPIFFALAGFFAAMLIEKRGMAGLLRNRFLRVGMPLVASAMVSLDGPSLSVVLVAFADSLLDRLPVHWGGDLLDKSFR